MSVLVPDAARSMSWRWVSTRGSGKSTALGRVVLPGDAFRHDPVPVVFIDPGGRGVDIFLDECCRMTRREQERNRLRDRLIYVDVGVSLGYVFRSFPLLYRLGAESLMTIAARPIEVLIRSDPALSQAPILGANAIRALGIPGAMILTALGEPLRKLPDLLSRPQAWAGRIQEAQARHPGELAEAAGYFLSIYPKLSERERQTQSGSLRTKLAFLADPAWAAVFGDEAPQIDLDEATAKRSIVLLDFRAVPTYVRRFAVCWIHNWFVEWVRHRGPSKETAPVSLIVDEATYLLGDPEQKEDALAAELQEAVQRLFRNANIWSVYCHQEIHQLSKTAARLFEDLGIQTYGATSDLDTAMLTAKRFFRWSGREVKKSEQVHHAMTRYEDAWTETRTTEFSRDELAYRQALAFLDLPTFTYYLGVPSREGELPTSLRRISIAKQVEGRWVQEDLVTETRRLLSRRGVLIGTAADKKSEASTPAGLSPGVYADEPPPTSRPR